jgi:hypothetical protein
VLAAAAACSGGGAGAGHGAAQNGGADAEVPFDPDPPRVYVAKVKNVLVGLPPTDAEVQAVETDPSKLKGLVQGWMALPQYQAKMLRFFQLAFQQTQVSITDFADQAYPIQADANSSTQPLIVQNATESFARTVLELIAEGRPFTEAMTTRRYMMTPALMELYAFLDVWQVDDAGKVSDRFKAANPTLTVTVEAAQGPIPIADSLNPSSPNYMHWYNPEVGTAPAFQLVPGCTQDPIVYPAPVSAQVLHYLLYGSIAGWKTTTGTACAVHGGNALARQFAAEDFTTWKMVTVRAPATGEAVTPFYDLPNLRAATELVLNVPRLGFFSTPAFFANWQTNTSNQMRVTMNQSLIVTTGKQVDGTDATLPPSTPGLDAMHLTDPACVSCHRSLDPRAPFSRRRTRGTTTTKPTRWRSRSRGSSRSRASSRR